MWYGSHEYLNEFITENKCRRIMEIGVYNGENAVSMIKTASNMLAKSSTMDSIFSHTILRNESGRNLRSWDVNIAFSRATH